MKLLPLDNPELIELVASWLGREENYKWLDFGNGILAPTAVSLKIMTQRDVHVLRAFTPDDSDLPIGVVALSNVDRRFKTAVDRGDQRAVASRARAAPLSLHRAPAALPLDRRQAVRPTAVRPAGGGARTR